MNANDVIDAGNSTHQVEVVPVHLTKHPNADTLSVAQVYGYPVVVRTQDWQEGQLGAYLPPDSVVDVARPEFAFLAKGTKAKHRIRACKLRGVLSFGLLIPAPTGAEEGQNLADHFGVEHYKPEMKSACTGGEAESAPLQLAHLAKYDVDALRRYQHVFVPGEAVLVTEKIHGANSRFAWADGRMWCGSRSEWKRDEENNLWWKAMRNTPAIRDFCYDHPGCVLYGEVYGDVQSLRYGRKKGEYSFAAFDVLCDGSWVDALRGRRWCEEAGVPVVPLLAEMPFDFEAICALAEGASTVPGADHIREGCVHVKPLMGRFHQAVGRCNSRSWGPGTWRKTTDCQRQLSGGGISDEFTIRGRCQREADLWNAYWAAGNEAKGQRDALVDFYGPWVRQAATFRKRTLPATSNSTT